MLEQELKSCTLADTISNILNVAPSSVDPEDDVEDFKAKVTEGAIDDDDEIFLSKLRKNNIDFLEDVDKKYASRKSSRRDLINSDEDWETDEELETRTDNSSDGESDQCSLDSEDSDREQCSSDDSQNEDGDNNSETSDVDENTSQVSHDDNFKQMNDNDMTTQIPKGNCVRNQMNIWENLLEIRIQLQKCLVTANKMPQRDVFKEIKIQSPDIFDSKVNETKQNVGHMLNKLLELQLILLKQYPETKHLLEAQGQTNKSYDSDEEILSDTDVENDNEIEATQAVPCKRRKISDYETEIKNNHNIYSSYKDSIIQKWYNKTRIGVFKNNTPVHPILNQIEHILNNKQKLIKRTQVKRSNYEIFGKNSSCGMEKQVEVNEENDAEIFDDDDFYHQLLRELIGVKSADLTDPVQLGRQWIKLQDMRSKMKRNIDNRATKGRKIRYNVHTKLVNFMAPVSNNLYAEKAQTELYNSLFGNK